MQKLLDNLLQLQKVLRDYFSYIKLLKRQNKSINNHTDYLVEYIGELEQISHDLSSVFDEDNDLKLIGNKKLMGSISQISEFFSSIDNM